ncbi:MAG: conjugal transfer protein TraF, partial [Gammaproteobacteria bacterium]|nr:conjugal transfer protein TraF [Gammaproteobacteria bacterium]
LTSAAQARFAVFAEVGVSISRQFDLAGQQWALGVTPKYVEVLTYDYLYLGKDIDTAEFTLDEGEKRYSSFNVDIGAAHELGDGWQIGAVIKNLIPQEYETIRNNTITLDPQLRIGAAHRSDWTTVAIDLDLSENDPIGFGPATQYLGAGVEFNLWETLQLRAGYRHNLSDSDTSVATAGIGLSPFGVHIDLAAAANSDEITGSLQLGVRF